MGTVVQKKFQVSYLVMYFIVMKQFTSNIIRNERICADFFEMTLSWDAPVPAPGHFLTIRVSGDSVPLLRRPFAFAGYDAASSAASVIYQKRGRGTEIMAEKKGGERIDVIGPLGTPFPIDDGAARAVIVAGGVGVGPILYLSTVLKERGVDTSFIFGCRNASFIPDTKIFKDAAAHICTDDGSAGFAGTVVLYIDGNINIDNDTTVYACGPEPMLKSLYKSARSSNAKKIWVSLEAMMACGVGACMGCAAPTVGGYRRVCKEGPVFNGDDILWAS